MPSCSARSSSTRLPNKPKGRQLIDDEKLDLHPWRPETAGNSLPAVGLFEDRRQSQSALHRRWAVIHPASARQAFRASATRSTRETVSCEKCRQSGPISRGGPGKSALRAQSRYNALKTMARWSGASRGRVGHRQLGRDASYPQRLSVRGFQTHDAENDWPPNISGPKRAGKRLFVAHIKRSRHVRRGGSDGRRPGGAGHVNPPRYPSWDRGNSRGCMAATRCLRSISGRGATTRPADRLARPRQRYPRIR